ncbi:unnamed protein product [Dimorphilus gyrociliatus]|uniref:Uncharacterized protein n=1 Tax=Dimorphilus gyrociliatus TaxID=2664684 RepID=A0A7I8VH37_9ANNE|nr:unnamed protein product [Dimorphilus gyrociliatus]
MTTSQTTIRRQKKLLRHIDDYSTDYGLDKQSITNLVNNLNLTDCEKLTTIKRNYDLLKVDFQVEGSYYEYSESLQFRLRRLLNVLEPELVRIESEKREPIDTNQVWIELKTILLDTLSIDKKFIDILYRDSDFGYCTINNLRSRPNRKAKVEYLISFLRKFGIAGLYKLAEFCRKDDRYNFIERMIINRLND